MPATSIRDLVIKDDDLVVGTHGRSFWILDDITPLREITAQTPAADVHLFAPQQAWRFRWNKNTDTPLPPDEPAGLNPPDGAIVHLLLEERRQRSRHARDSGRTECRGSQILERGSTEPLVEGRNTPDYWIRAHRPLLASAGLHRFVWDMHHERPAVANFSYPIAAIFQNTPRVPLGSWAVPGTYTVRLTAMGDPDPSAGRQDGSARDGVGRGHQAQYDTSRAIDAALRRASTALSEIRKMTTKSAPIADLEQRLSRVVGTLSQLFNA